jgi:hypothetical protein
MTLIVFIVPVSTAAEAGAPGCSPMNIDDRHLTFILHLGVGVAPFISM